MDINPLALLEVTMGSDPVEEDDDCIILDPPPIETHIIEDTSDPVLEPEPELVAGTGVHFLQSESSVEDPLSLPSAPENTASNRDIPYLWVSTNKNNLASVSNSELEFRKSQYKDLQNVLKGRLHCTICQDHVGCDIRVHPKSIEHPVLKVLVCEKCSTQYKNLQFTLNDKGKETRCRWCGRSPMGGGPTLRRCHQCPFSFCEVCLYHNLPQNKPTAPVWTCCVCNLKQLWPARAQLWALESLKSRLLSKNVPPAGDISRCTQQCQKERLSKKKGNQTFQAQKALPKRAGPTKGSKAQRVNGQQSTIMQAEGSVQEQLQKYPILQMTLTPSLLDYNDAPTHLDYYNPPPPDERTIKMKTIWLKSKLENYERDILNMANKLKKLRENLLEEEYSYVINTKVETVTTLLSLNSNLFKDCSLNLMNDWKEKKSRHTIECMNTNLTPNLFQPPETVTRENSKIVASRRMPPGKSTRKVNGPTFRNVRKPPVKSRNKFNMKLINLIKQYGIRECFVKLERLSQEVIYKAINSENQSTTK